MSSCRHSEVICILNFSSNILLLRTRVLRLSDQTIHTYAPLYAPTRITCIFAWPDYRELLVLEVKYKGFSLYMGRYLFVTTYHIPSKDISYRDPGLGVNTATCLQSSLQLRVPLFVNFRFIALAPTPALPALSPWVSSSPV